MSIHICNYYERKILGNHKLLLYFGLKAGAAPEGSTCTNKSGTLREYHIDPKTWLDLN